MMVADASVWINLVATGVADRILRALARPLAITDVAFGELDRGRPKGRQAADEVTALVHVGLARMVSLDPVDEPLFLSLVSGSTVETIDDGEAATIACAVRLDAGTVIDERKATSLAVRRFTHLEVRATTDLLLAPEVRGALGHSGLGEAIYLALVGARMRVPDRHTQEIVRLLGAERVGHCLSLSGRVRNQQGG